MKLLGIKAERNRFLKRKLKLWSKSYEITENYNLVNIKDSQRLILVKCLMIKVVIVKTNVHSRYLKKLISSYGKGNIG